MIGKIGLTENKFIMRRLIILCSLFMIANQVVAQVKLVTKQTNPFQLAMQDVQDCNIISSVEGRFNLLLTLKDPNNAAIFNLKILNKKIEMGVNEINFSEWQQIQWASSDYTPKFQSGEKLLKGNFILCLNLYTLSDEVVQLDECSSYYIQEPLPLRLITPEDEEVLKNPLPLFRWIGIQPEIEMGKYQIIISEWKSNQSKEEAMAVNTPLVYERDLFETVMPYQTASPELENGKKYVWQVIEYTNGSELSRSEIWSFVYKETPKNKTSLQFVNIQSNGAYQNIEFDKSIRIAYKHPNMVKTLTYTILHKQSGKNLEKLPEVKITSGLNYIEIPTREIKELKKGEQYVFKIMEDTQYLLEFKIK